MRLGETPNPRDASVNGIIAHCKAAPAGGNQIITRHHLATTARKGHKDLHDAGLEQFTPLSGDHFALGGTNAQGSQSELCFL